MTTAARPEAPAKAPPYPGIDEMIDALCWAARRIEADSVRPSPERLRRIACLDAAIVELTRLKHMRRTHRGM